MLSHLFIIDPPETYVSNNDTSAVLIEEAKKRGHKVFVGNINELGVKDSRAVVRDRFVRDFDVVWLRKDPPIDTTYIQHLQLLCLERDNCFFVNDPLTILKYLDKGSIFEFPHLIPETIITNDKTQVENFLKGRDRVVVKPLNGFSGHGVRLYEGGDIELNEFVMVQEFLVGVKNGDTRVNICGGEIIGTLKRIPQGDDFRGNIHAGAKGVKTELSTNELEIANEVAKWLTKEGIFFAGIDLIAGKLSEINITSPGSIVETNGVMGAQLEIKIFDLLERHV